MTHCRPGGAASSATAHDLSSSQSSYASQLTPELHHRCGQAISQSVSHSDGVKMKELLHSWRAKVLYERGQIPEAIHECTQALEGCSPVLSGTCSCPLVHFPTSYTHAELPLSLRADTPQL